MLDTELAAEQAHLDRAYDRLAVLQGKAIDLATSQLRTYASTPSAKVERDVREAHGVRRYASLRVDAGLCFGRIDRADGDTFHIGRVGVAEEDMSPLVVDWRAPIAEPFYRATPLEPLGLVRRRHLLTRGRRVVGIEDEALDLTSVDLDNERIVLVGEAALLGALTERRTGRMRDIVATIQSEQDRIIRAPLGGVLVVQGGPGTGKTAVALHRAAFLLYRHRFPLDEQGVLVVGPNPLFLRYIERVLPSLGESRCRLATVDDLHRVRTTVHERDRALAGLKGDLRMAGFVRRAVESRERALVRREVLGIGSFRLRIGHGATARMIDIAKARAGTHNERRPLVEQLVHRHLLRQYKTAVERARAAGLPAAALPDDEVLARLKSSTEVRRMLDRMWPALTAEELLSSLFAHEPLLREAAGGELSDEETSSLRRDTDQPWTTADLPLLDEADVLLGRVRPVVRKRPVPVEDAAAMVDRVLAGRIPYCLHCDSELTWIPRSQRWLCETIGCGAEYTPEQVMSPADAIEVRHLQQRVLQSVVADEPEESDAWFSTYGHVVVDEAQELSAMQWRVLARRCPTKSMTLVGDLAQASGPAASTSWDEAFTALGQPRGAVVELSVNYRTPAEVMELADRVSGRVAPARCVRDSGHNPRFVDASDDLLAIAASTAQEELDAVPEGKVAVIAPDAMVAGLQARIGTDAERALDADVSVLGPDDAKGLEFDSVVVVEPARFDDRSLYVALTRTTTRLALVYAESLPAALATSGSTR